MRLPKVIGNSGFRCVGHKLASLPDGILLPAHAFCPSWNARSKTSSLKVPWRSSSISASLEPIRILLVFSACLRQGSGTVRTLSTSILGHVPARRIFGPLPLRQPGDKPMGGRRVRASTPESLHSPPLKIASGHSPHNHEAPDPLRSKQNTFLPEIGTGHLERNSCDEIESFLDRMARLANPSLRWGPPLLPLSGYPRHAKARGIQHLTPA
jgi:hypothetical protein